MTSDGSPRIEAVYYRNLRVHAEECDSIEEARRFLEVGDEEMSLYSVGVFVDGEPRLTYPWQEAAKMREAYAKVLAAR